MGSRKCRKRTKKKKDQSEYRCKHRKDRIKWFIRYIRQCMCKVVQVSTTDDGCYVETIPMRLKNIIFIID